MKKLMIAAVVAAMGAGAFADCDEGKDCVFAYKLTMSGKTGIAYSTKGNASKCIESVCYLKPGSFKLTGYVYGATDPEGSPDTCNEGCACNDFSTIESVVYNKKAGFAAKDQIAIDTGVLRLIGSDAKKAQVVLTYNTDLVLAGFGTAKDGVLKSASGNFAGTVTAPKCEKCTYDAGKCEDDCTEDDAMVFTLCLLEKVAADKTVAYGKWSLKADKSAVKKLTKNYDPTVLLPKGVKLAIN